LLGLRALYAFLMSLVVSGCASFADPHRDPSPRPDFSPERFFQGETQGTGELRVIFSPPQRVHVRSRGRIEKDGTLVLDQRVEREGEAATLRQWRLRRDESGRYSGTLSEASGPVRGELRGGHLYLQYAMKGGLSVEQQLVPDASGLILENRLIVRAFGLPVARLEETIRKIR
jgi:hypothetical protein